MKWSTALRLSLVVAVLGGLALAAGGHAKDRWIHPRGEAFDPELHYRDAAGEIYYRAENDLDRDMGAISVVGGPQARVSVSLGQDLWDFAARQGGALRPVLLLDTDGDGIVDRSVRGSVEERNGVFRGPLLSELNLREVYWQVGVLYQASGGGDAAFDGRYLASVDSRTARVEYPRADGLAQVGAGPFESALVILKHREGSPFDLAEFAADPSRYVEAFVPLTPQEDLDDWTVDEKKPTKGRLRTHLGRENLFLVRAQPGFHLDVEWGDMPFAEYLERRLAVRANADGCYSSLDNGLENHDGSRVEVPQRLLYCPADSVALFDAPPGYQVGLSALRQSELHERTEAGTSILDNVRLYVREVFPRSPSRRATGNVMGNIVSGYKDAGLDLRDAAQHAVTGSYRRNIHSGQVSYRPSPVTAVPLFLWSLVRLRPLQAVNHLFAGTESGVQVAADVVSAATNALLNPMLQGTVGWVRPAAADTAGDWVGAVPQAVSKNLPLAERFSDALNPLSLWRHNRAFAPEGYTRTDTQLNIDRVISIANLVAIGAIIDGADGGGSDRRGPVEVGNGNGKPGFKGAKGAGKAGLKMSVKTHLKSGVKAGPKAALKTSFKRSFKSSFKGLGGSRFKRSIKIHVKRHVKTGPKAAVKSSFKTSLKTNLKTAGGNTFKRNVTTSLKTSFRAGAHSFSQARVHVVSLANRFGRFAFSFARP